MYSMNPVGCAIFLATAILDGSTTAAPAVNELSPPLVLEATIPLKAVAGRIDHIAVDLDKHQLIVAEFGNDTGGDYRMLTSPLIAIGLSVGMKRAVTRSTRSALAGCASVPTPALRLGNPLTTLRGLRPCAGPPWFAHRPPRPRPLR